MTEAPAWAAAAAWAKLYKHGETIDKICVKNICNKEFVLHLFAVE